MLEINIQNHSYSVHKCLVSDIHLLYGTFILRMLFAIKITLFLEKTRNLHSGYEYICVVHI